MPNTSHIDAQWRLYILGVVVDQLRAAASENGRPESKDQAAMDRAVVFWTEQLSVIQAHLAAEFKA